MSAAVEDAFNLTKLTDVSTKRRRNNQHQMSVRTPSKDQLQNLSRMERILSGNWKAELLVRSLWDFFNYDIYCEIFEEDGESNRYSIKGIEDPEKISQVRFRISLRKSERQVEGLVHELLHANLIPLGYPRFWIHSGDDADKMTLAAGVINMADHLVMLPIFVSLGFTPDRFLGDTRPLNYRETRVQADLQALCCELGTPEGYLDCVSSYLKRNQIQVTPLFLANAIVANRREHETVGDHTS